MIELSEFYCHCLTYCLQFVWSSKSLMLCLAASEHDYHMLLPTCLCESGFHAFICVDPVDLQLQDWPMSQITLVAVVLIWGRSKYGKEMQCLWALLALFQSIGKEIAEAFLSLQTHQCMHSDLPKSPVEYVIGRDCASRPIRCKNQEMQAVWWLSSV